jgi:hypothetical protein
MNRLPLLLLIVSFPGGFQGAALAAPAHTPTAGSGRIVALSDIHGAYGAM